MNVLSATCHSSPLGRFVPLASDALALAADVELSVRIL